MRRLQLGLWFSKCGPWTSSISITWELGRSASSGPHPDLLNSKHWGQGPRDLFSQALQVSWHPLKSEHHWAEYYSWPLSMGPLSLGPWLMKWRQHSEHTRLSFIQFFSGLLFLSRTNLPTGQMQSILLIQKKNLIEACSLLWWQVRDARHYCEED